MLKEQRMLNSATFFDTCRKQIVNPICRSLSSVIPQYSWEPHQWDILEIMSVWSDDGEQVLATNYYRLWLIPICRHVVPTDLYDFDCGNGNCGIYVTAEIAIRHTDNDVMRYETDVRVARLNDNPQNPIVRIDSRPYVISLQPRHLAHIIHLTQSTIQVLKLERLIHDQNLLSDDDRQAVAG